MEPPRRLGVTIDCLRSRRWVSCILGRGSSRESRSRFPATRGARRKKGGSGGAASPESGGHALGSMWGVCRRAHSARSDRSKHVRMRQHLPLLTPTNPHRVPALGPVDRRQRAHRLRGEFPAEAQVLQITNMVSKAAAPIPSVHAGTRPSCPRPPCFFPISDFFFSPHRSVRRDLGRSRSGMRARSAHSRILASRLHVFSTRGPRSGAGLARFLDFR